MVKKLWALLPLLALAACGGGGSSSGSGSTAEVGAEFLGVWKSACFSQNLIFDGSGSIVSLTSAIPASRPTLYITRQLTVTRRDATSLKAEQLYTVYGPMDTTCSGTVRGTISSLSTSGNTSSITATSITSSGGYPVITLDSTGSVTNGGPTVTAKLASVQRTTLLSGSETMYAYAGSDGAGHKGFGIYGGDFAALNFKDAYYATATTLSTGLSPGASYPTALGTTALYMYTKQ